MSGFNRVRLERLAVNPSSERLRLFLLLLKSFSAASFLLPAFAFSAGSSALSLADLIRDDGRVESTNGALKFDDFSASLHGLPRSQLSRFHVVPLLDGFRVETDSDFFLPSGAQLTLRYEAESEGDEADAFEHFGGGHHFGCGHHFGGGHDKSDDDDHRFASPLRSMSLGLVGTSVLSGQMTAWGDDDSRHHDEDQVLGTVRAFIRGPFDATDLDRASRELDIVAIFLGFGDGGAPVGPLQRGSGPPPRPGAEMRFSTQPIPEPSTVVLMGLGLLGLTFSARSRRVGRFGGG